MGIESHRFDLHAMMKEIQRMLQHRIQEKKLAFTAFVQPEISRIVYGDSVRIRQVLLNLAGNAIKFTESGEVTIRVERVSEDDHVLRFNVRDTGIGIPRESLATLFESFTQVDATTTRKFGGTGLGLTISKRLVELMHGQIGVDSEVGEGSEFWFTLPLMSAENGSSDEDYREFNANGVSQGESLNAKIDFQYGRLLLAEDNIVNQKVATRMLKKLGFEVDCVTNGKDAISAVQHADYDFILMDVQMPVMDGLEATRKIRGGENGNHIPVIAMTANAMRGDRDLCLAAGMDDYISKPVNQKSLEEVLRKYVK